MQSIEILRALMIKKAQYGNIARTLEEIADAGKAIERKAGRLAKTYRRLQRVKGIVFEEVAPTANTGYTAYGQLSPKTEKKKKKEEEELSPPL